MNLYKPKYFLLTYSNKNVFCLRGPVVQRLEPSAHNGVVVSSNLTGPTINIFDNFISVFSIQNLIATRASVTNGFQAFSLAFNINVF